MYTACISVFADLSRQAVRSVYVTRWKQLVANCRGWGWGGEVVVGGGGGEWGEGRGGGGGWVDQEFKNQGLLREQEKSKEFTLLTVITVVIMSETLFWISLRTECM